MLMCLLLLLLLLLLLFEGLDSLEKKTALE